MVKSIIYYIRFILDIEVKFTWSTAGHCVVGVH
jgi:hypothetical protein